MRHNYSSITATVVHQHAQQALQRVFDWQAYHQSVSVLELLRLLLLMAARNRSLFATVRRFCSFSHETARQAIKAQGLSQDLLTTGLVNALHDVALFSRKDRQRHWKVAIDTHNVAYYGKRTPHLIGGPKKQGTKLFHGYASAALVHKGRRYTVGLMALSPRWKPHEVVQTLLDQIARKDLKIKGVAVDAAFGSGETLLLLQERCLAYVVPLQRRGKDNSIRNRLFQNPHQSIRWTQWTERTGRLVCTRTFLWKGSHKTLLFAFDGCSAHAGRNLHETARRQRQFYRRRFGIETSYRQKNQAQAQTTSRDPVYRLLLEGVAYLLRQVWVVLTAEIARRTHAKPNAWMGQLTFDLLLDWLTDELTANLPDNRSIPLDAIG